MMVEVPLGLPPAGDENQSVSGRGDEKRGRGQ
jgi:hypothetical protein